MKANEPRVSAKEISELWQATDDELLTIIGMNALPLIVQPMTLLQLGREGLYDRTQNDALGKEYKVESYKNTAHLFFGEWQSQLLGAVCKNSKLAADIQKATLAKRDVAIALAVGALTIHIPEIAPLGGLLTSLAVFLVKSGTEAFCKTVAAVGVKGTAEDTSKPNISSVDKPKSRRRSGKTAVKSGKIRG
jgi:hypothetical protein